MDELELQKVIAKLLFRSPDEAAIDALNKITEPTYELGGVVYKDKDGFYSYSNPQGDERSGKFKAEVRIPRSATPTAIYHTHPGYGDAAEPAESFSPDDVKTADQLKMLSYIRAMESGNIKKYEPGKSKTESLGFGVHRGKQATGETVYAKVEK